jgi:hypothetical protein
VRLSGGPSPGGAFERGQPILGVEPVPEELWASTTFPYCYKAARLNDLDLSNIFNSNFRAGLSPRQGKGMMSRSKDKK